jgi:S-adenosylmethionine:tRNA ribosyltransferase-isomerase
MPSTPRYRTSDFDYELPPELVAQAPLPERATSRLLHVDASRLEDLAFADLPGLLAPADVLVLNDTRVVNARLRGVKPTGGRVELMVERVLSATEALAQCRASHLPKPGTTVRIEDAFDVEVVARDGRWTRFRVLDARSIFDLLEAFGSVPLPPYITREPRSTDKTRYQTVYARTPGAVAAPTAGLHFDDALLDVIRARGVAVATLTLHVGAGTFLPVEVEDPAEHRMHAEWFTVPETTVRAIERARQSGGRVVAVGTTVLRALESAVNADGTLCAGDAETSLFITPGYVFRVVDRLLTNFHLPRSTLLMLVSAFGGYEAVRRAYAHAVAQRYRFFSYGDAMLVERNPGRTPP